MDLLAWRRRRGDLALLSLVHCGYRHNIDDGGFNWQSGFSWNWRNLHWWCGSVCMRRDNTLFDGQSTSKSIGNLGRVLLVKGYAGCHAKG
jgi:hypothetical protein